jgi:DNA helicase-2/ATP-dependent DNA helicase PcrA
MTHTQMRQIFGTTRWNRPSRFIGEMPAGVFEHVATKAMAGEARSPRFVDRDDVKPVAARPWRHPQAAAPAPDPGDRYVDHDFFDDRSDDVTDMPLRRGARVRHDRFGEGEVLRIVSVGEPAVVAFFPGWGEKKILARFLRPA